MIYKCVNKVDLSTYDIPKLSYNPKHDVVRLIFSTNIYGAESKMSLSLPRKDAVELVRKFEKRMRRAQQLRLEFPKKNKEEVKL